mgnify:CR=1 FL=1
MLVDPPILQFVAGCAPAAFLLLPLNRAETFCRTLKNARESRYVATSQETALTGVQSLKDVSDELEAILENFKTARFENVVEMGLVAWDHFAPILSGLLTTDLRTLTKSRIGWLIPPIGGWILFFVAFAAKLMGKAEYQPHFEAYMSQISEAVNAFQPGLDELHKAWAEATALKGCQSAQQCQRVLEFLLTHQLLKLTPPPPPAVEDKTSAAVEHQKGEKESEPEMKESYLPELRSLVNRHVILLTGTMQSGKTTFTRELHQYANVTPPEHLQVGDGNKPSTMTPAVYELDIKPYKFVCSVQGLKEIIEGQKEPDNESILRLRQEEAFARQGTDHPIIRLSILDTPGLNVADEKQDEQHVFDILQLLSFFPSVTQVVLVNYGPFGADFVRFLNYYYKMLPALQPRFVLVHTHYDVWNRPKEKVRKQDFLSITGLSLQHFFVDIPPEESRAISGKDWTFRFNEALTHNLGINALLFKAAAEDPISVGEITYRKTTGVSGKEKLLAGYCASALGAFKVGMTQKKDDKSTKLVKLLDVYQEQVDLLYNRIDPLTEELDNYTAREWAEVGSDIGHGYWGWLWGVKEVLRVTSPDFPIRAEDATAVPSYGCIFSKISQVNDYEICAELSAPLWTSLFGKLTARANPKKFFAKKIKSCEEALKAAKAEYNVLDKEASNLGEQAAHLEQEVENLRALCKNIGKVHALLKKEAYTIEEFLRQQLFFDLNAKARILLPEYFKMLGLPTPAFLVQQEQVETPDQSDDEGAAEDEKEKEKPE